MSELVKRLRANGQACGGEVDKRTGEAEFQYFVAQAGPFAEGAPVCVLGEADGKAIADELIRLEAIVEKLPKTVDGVPIVPWMTVYGFDADGDICETVIGDSVPMCDDGDPSGEPFDEDDWFFGGASCVFSTHEAAALAAQRKDN